METLQLASIKSRKENNSVHPVWSKLPTSTTNIADLGKRGKTVRKMNTNVSTFFETLRQWHNIRSTTKFSYLDFHHHIIFQTFQLLKSMVILRGS